MFKNTEAERTGRADSQFSTRQQRYDKLMSCPVAMQQKMRPAQLTLTQVSGCVEQSISNIMPTAANSSTQQ